MQLTNKIILNMMELLEKEYISLNKFTKNQVLNKLLEHNAIKIIGSSPKMIHLNSSEIVFKTLKKYGYLVESISDLKRLLDKSDSTNKIDNLDYFEHTKVKESKSFEGIMLSSLENIEILIDNQLTKFYKTLYGSGTFFHSSVNVVIPDNVILVGIENPQVIWFINRYKHLFNQDKHYIFLSLSEFKTSYQYKWLESFKGEYIHFGDFDLAGINIYLNSVLPRLNKCKSHSFLIPENIYKIMIEKNYKKDYSNQTRYLNIDSKDDEKLKELINFIKKQKITLEQEFLSRSLN